MVVTSNDDTLSAQDLSARDVALGEKQLMRVEECWRQLKSGLRLRPVCHFHRWRIESHVSISVLGLLLERIAELRVADTWRNIRRKLEKIRVVEYEHRGARVQQTTGLSSEPRTLLRKLDVEPPPKLLSVTESPASASGA